MEENNYVQVDREILPVRYFAEDDLMRSIRNCPEYVGTMTVCVDSFENGLAQGRLHTYYFENPIPFFSLDQLLFAMEDVMDQAGAPQAWMEKRTFTKAKGKRKKNVPKEEPDRSMTPVYDLQTMRPQKGRVASFYVRVYSRMHASMQGVVKVSGTSNSAAFRSELELLYLIREGLSLPKKNYGKARTENAPQREEMVFMD